MHHGISSSSTTSAWAGSRFVFRISPGGSSSFESDDGEEEEECDDGSEYEDDEDTNESRQLQQNQQQNDNDEDDIDHPVALDILKLVGNVVVETTRGVSRAIKAGIHAVHSTDSSSSDGASCSTSMNPLQKTFHVLSCMVKAALDRNDSKSMYHFDKMPQKVSSSGSSSKVVGKKGGTRREQPDLTHYLAQAYGVDSLLVLDDDDDMDDSSQAHATVIMGGSLSDALSKARSQARLLVVYIPSSKPRNKKKQNHDTMAIQSLLSRKVIQVAEKSVLSSRSKEDVSQMQGERGGSFAFWSTRYGSKEKVSAMKRLKVKSLGNSSKNPILLVVYPYAAPTLNALGQVQIVPRVLAQHHCNPPPGEESMAKWLNSLRKRHKKLYAKMQHDLVELKLFKERQVGYQSSIEDDRVREEKEKEKRRIEAEREQAEKQRLQDVLERRKELQDSLADEPDKGKEGVVTVAVRFSDGSRGQRCFDGDELIDQVFNWVDVEFEIERETFDLVTMNGKKTFAYGKQKDLCLKDTGMGKMFALRVIKKAQSDLDKEGSSQGENIE